VSEGLLTVLQPGIGTTVQDAGRFGHRHEGIPVSGWLDPVLARAAHALVDNAGTEALLELRGLGTELEVTAGPVRLALTGAVDATLVPVESPSQPMAAWRSHTLQSGDRLRFGAARSGCAYLAVHGGLAVPSVLGSRSSYGRAGLPGVLGRALHAGDVLPCVRWARDGQPELCLPEPWLWPQAPLRVVLGPQDDHMAPESLAHLLSEPWEATAEQDRMGVRLRGRPLRHATPAHADIVSDAVAPGAVQLPASGQPIVLLADSQTVGGYPKIATVIRADLPRLAHRPPGTRLRFEAVPLEAARQALLDLNEAVGRWLAQCRPYRAPGFVDLPALYGSNLISGVESAILPD
jgi:5-oxoprolinase (ATP-hydrolysing) subunit C